MQAAEFRPETFPRGALHRLELEFRAGGRRLWFPVLLVRGCESGPVLLASAGVHGDEYEGVRAILDVVAGLDPGQMRGDLLAVPVVNVAAFEQRARRSPLDGLDLARVFPGHPDGSPSEALAWHFDQFILARADLYVDLHSGGVTWEMPVLAGYDASDSRGRAAAFAFGAPVVWTHPSTPLGRTVSAAKERGIPSLYAEAHGGGRIGREDLALYTRGLRNLLRHCGILPGLPESGPPPLQLYGGGNIDESLRASCDGFLKPEVVLLDPVEQGRLLGTLLDLAGRPIEEYRAPQPGRVVLIHACPRVAAGDPVFLVTGAAG